MILLKLAEGTRLLFYDEISQPKSWLTESLYIRFVNDFKDDYLVRDMIAATSANDTQQVWRQCKIRRHHFLP
jgi:hypothetical protein